MIKQAQTQGGCPCWATSFCFEILIQLYKKVLLTSFDLSFKKGSCKRLVAPVKSDILTT